MAFFGTDKYSYQKSLVLEDYQMIAGDESYINFNVIDKSGRFKAIDCTFEWSLANKMNGKIIYITTNVDFISDSIIKLYIPKEATINESGVYIQQLDIKAPTGQNLTPVQGIVRILKSNNTNQI